MQLNAHIPTSRWLSDTLLARCISQANNVAAWLIRNGNMAEHPAMLTKFTEPMLPPTAARVAVYGALIARKQVFNG